MKKIVLIGLCLAASNAFAQKDALKWISGTWALKTNDCRGLIAIA